MIRKIGHLLIVLGVLLLAGAGVMVMKHKREDQEAGKQSVIVLESLQIMEVTEPDPAVKPDYMYRPQMDMPKQTVDGIDYVGMIKIPTLELTLPVIHETTKKYLKIAPCRYAGSAYQDDLVIGAHNYETHFGNIGNLQYGDPVTFTDIDGNVFSYVVADIEILQPTQVEEMCSGEWPLTLYTCTLGGQSRVTVRCESVLNDKPYYVK